MKQNGFDVSLVGNQEWPPKYVKIDFSPKCDSSEIKIEIKKGDIDGHIHTEQKASKD